MSGPGLPDDEVVTLGARLGAAILRREDLERREYEARKAKNLSAETYFKNATLHASDEVHALRNMVTVAKAKTLEGAAIQIAEAINRVDFIRDDDPEEDLRAVNRLLFSVLDVVDGAADRKLAEVVIPDFDNRHTDPWRPVERRLADI